MARPGVSLVVPFFGSHEEADALLDAVGRLERAAGDEVILVDNTPQGVVHAPPAGVRLVQARDHPSSYYARNVGAEAADNDWLLFMDADCVPAPDLLEAYLRSPIEPDVGAVAGEIEPRDDRPLARYVASRGLLSQAQMLARHPWPAAVTANLLVRRAAWESVGGFQEGIRSGGDTEFCWRLQEAGWRLDQRPEAVVRHRHRDRLRDLGRQVARHGAGAAWLNRRYPGSSPRPPLGRGLLRCAAGVVAWTLSGRLERARFKAVDAVVLIATSFGYLAGTNGASRPTPRRGDFEAVILADSFPKLSETFVAGEAKALRRLGYRIRVEAIIRPSRPLRGGARGLQVSYREDDSLLARLTGFASLAAARPLRCARDAVAQRSWRRGGDHVTRLPSLALVARRLRRGGERHLHAHFATSAALEAMRLSSLLDRPYSVAPHAYDIFSRPTNLRQKLVNAAFIATDCRYNVEQLRERFSADGVDRVHEIVLGVDASRFRRKHPPPDQRIVGTVGRLVEKKGFATLIEAAAELERRGAALGELAIVGDGPLRDELKDLTRRMGIESRVRFLGALEPDDVLAFLEGIDVFAMPCVIASDGDRDSMPVVVKEALAMEVPVVASDVVGLPEVIRLQWGRLVPPADPSGLADALEELLALGVEARVEMGARGRAHVVEHCNIEVEAGKLARLMGLS